MSHPTPHDAAFKASMKDLMVAKDFFEAHLPKEILAQVDLSTLKLMDGSFVDEKLKAHYTDILYQVQFGKKEGFLYLLSEHYTNASPFIPLYMLSYQCQIAKQFLEQNKENKRLPSIFGLMFYHGKRTPYPYSSLIENCFEDPEFAKEHFLKGFHLVDISICEDEEIRQHKTAALMEMLQKHCYARDLMPILRKLKPILEYLVQVGATHQIGYNFKYMLEIMDAKDINQAINEISALLPKTMSGEIMSIAEQLRQQGLEQGLEQGFQQGIEKEKEEMALKLLRRRQDIEFIVEVTDLTPQQIKSLQKNV